MTDIYDINGRIGYNGKPDVLRNADAIQGMLYNLFSTYINTEKFEDGHGSRLEAALQEPCSPAGALDVLQGIIDDLNREMPILKVNMTRTSVVPDYSLPGYAVELAYSVRGSNVGTYTFRLPSQGGS